MNNAKTHNPSVKQQQKGTHTDFTVWALGLIALVVFCNTAAAINSPVKADAASQARLVETYGKLPLSFEVNQGQTGKTARFLAHGPGYGLFLTPTEAMLSLHKPKLTPSVGKLATPALSASAKKPLINAVQSNQDTAVTLHMKLVGGNPNPAMKGLDELPGKVNYFRGHDPKQWHTNIPTYAKVKYEKVYPGIDLVYYGNQRQLEYDFIVAPGADPKAVRLAFEGADKLAIDKQGDLVLKSGGDDVRLHKPRVYQDINGQQREIEGRYTLRPAKGHGKVQVSFQVAAYDKSKPLIIDPVLVYSTYLGGTGLDIGSSIAIDNNGNAYVAGATTSLDFPTVTSALQGTHGSVTDIFVSKFNPSGTALTYSTFLGGSGSDTHASIAVDSTGNAYVMGETDSPDFPTANPVFPNLMGATDAVVVKINSSGSSLIYSTYLGGSGDEYDPELDQPGQRIAADSAGNAYVVGSTSSGDYPTTAGSFRPTQPGGGAYSAYITKLNSSGSALIYSTYLGHAFARGVAVDSLGNTYVTGFTDSLDFPTKNAFQ